MIAPGRGLARVLLVPAGLSLGLLFVPGLLPAVLALDAAVAAVAIADLLTLPRPRRLRAERLCETVASRGEPHHVVVRIHNPGRTCRGVDLRDDVPPGMEAQPAAMRADLPARSSVELEYRLVPRERGRWSLEWVHGRAGSRLGLWQRVFRLPAGTTLAVHPDLRQMPRYAMYARLDRLGLIGVRRVRAAGAEHEFERLRDYTEDDPLRRVDWKATARRERLTVREYQADRSQRVLLLLDCGRNLAGTHGGKTLLDRSLDAALLLAWVALRHGDRVGLLAYAERVLAWVPPRGGTRHLHRLVHAAFDLFPRLVEPRHDEAFDHLARHSRRRALVVTLTNLADEAGARRVEDRLARLRGRHLPLAVLLRDPVLFEAVRHPEVPSAPDAAEDIAPAHRRAAAQSLLDEREAAVRELRARGALVVDSEPERLTPELVNRYLAVKARGLL